MNTTARLSGSFVCGMYRQRTPIMPGSAVGSHPKYAVDGSESFLYSPTLVISLPVKSGNTYPRYGSRELLDPVIDGQEVRSGDLKVVLAK